MTSKELSFAEMEEIIEGVDLWRENRSEAWGHAQFEIPMGQPSRDDELHIQVGWSKPGIQI